MRLIRKFFRNLLLMILALLAGLILYNWNLIGYGIEQGRGQLHIIWNARDVEDYMDDPETPDTLREKLKFIEEVRRFAIDSLGLSDTKNYKTLYDQQGKPVMWVVTASEAFRLEPKEWKFPVLGSVPYKGFFDEEKARQEASALDAEGLDVRLQNPGAWSTLGWFTDPILSGMLERDEGDLASLIIHEMVHATLFVKDSVTFNENLASFIGDRGAELFMQYRYGANDIRYITFKNENEDFEKYTAHILRGANVLDSLYASFSESDGDGFKRSVKERMIRKIVRDMDTLTTSSGRRYSVLFTNKLPNNAYFLSFRHYQEKQDVLVKVWATQFGGDFKAFLNYFRERYPSV